MVQTERDDEEEDEDDDSPASPGHSPGSAEAIPAADSDRKLGLPRLGRSWFTPPGSRAARAA